MRTHRRNGLDGVLIFLTVMLVLLSGGEQRARAESDIAVITKAAKQGEAKAQYNLGLIYDTGEGIPQDYKQAVYWYRKAAEQGNENAQFELGLMCDRGRGGPQDAKQAVYWYRKAAEQGRTMAQYNLGIMYEYGKGVPQNDVYAYAWYCVAAAQGVGAKDRDILAQKLTPEQRGKAQELAVEIQTKIDHKKP